jgi:hypothetical protein
MKKFADSTLFSPLFLLFFAVALFLSSCQKDLSEPIPTDTFLKTKKAATARNSAPMADAVDATVAIEWYRMTNDLIKSTPGYTPPVASRALGYLGVGFYEAMYPGNPGRRSLAGQLTDLHENMLPFVYFEENFHWGIVANSYFKTMTAHLFPFAPQSQRQAAEALAEQWKQDFFQGDLSYLDNGWDILTRSENFGVEMANAIFAWSKTDAVGHEGYLKNFPANYVLPMGANKWVPTGADQIPLQPYWGQVRSFMPNSNAISLKAPNPFSTIKNSNFYKEALQVYQTGQNISPQQKTIALYWADGAGTITPPGHSAAMAIQIIEAHQLNLGEAADVMAKIGIGVADAFILCWKTKYQYNLLRPVTYINKYIDPAWKPLINTPPFPEHTSGHSTQSGATAEILTYLFGNVSFTDKTHEYRTDSAVPYGTFTPRTFPNFYEMANEAANSRLYGGIHYARGNQVGLEQGYYIGKLVNTLKIYYGQ